MRHLSVSSVRKLCSIWAVRLSVPARNPLFGEGRKKEFWVVGFFLHPSHQAHQQKMLHDDKETFCSGFSVKGIHTHLILFLLSLSLTVLL